MSLTVDDLRGRLIDCDSHENLPVPLWSDAFGDAAGLLGQQYMAMLSNPDSHLNDFCRENVVDEMEVIPQTVWGAKGCTTPGRLTSHDGRRSWMPWASNASLSSRRWV